MFRRLPLAMNLTATGDSGGRFVLFLALSGLTILATLLVPVPSLRSLLLGAATVLLVIALVGGANALWQGFRRRLARFGALKEIELLNRPVVLTDHRGRILGGNTAAKAAGDLETGQHMDSALQSELADPESVTARMLDQALLGTTAERRLASGRVMSASANYGDTILWIFSSRDGDLEASPLPSFQVSDQGEVLAQNTAAARMFGPSGSDFSTQVVQEPLNEARPVA